jgi:hypothetical protein
VAAAAPSTEDGGMRALRRAVVERWRAGEPGEAGWLATMVVGVAAGWVYQWRLHPSFWTATLLLAIGAPVAFAVAWLIVEKIEDDLDEVVAEERTTRVLQERDADAAPAELGCDADEFGRIVDAAYTIGNHPTPDAIRVHAPPEVDPPARGGDDAGG